MPRLPAALLFALLAAAPLLAQPAPITICIVQTKPNAATQFDPSAGPWAAGIDKQLSTQKLRTGAPLHLTVLAASTEKDVLPEVRRLQCPWVIQLWVQHNPDLDNSQGDVSTNGVPPFDPQLAPPEAIGSEDSIFFSLWNGATKKVIARGAAPLRLSQAQPPFPPDPLRANPLTCRALTQQIVSHLNKLP